MKSAMTLRRRSTIQALGLALALAGTSPGLLASQGDDDDGYRAGKVFTSTNGAAGNELLVYDSARTRGLKFVKR